LGDNNQAKTVGGIMRVKPNHLAGFGQKGKNEMGGEKTNSTTKDKNLLEKKKEKINSGAGVFPKKKKGSLGGGGTSNG